jgi:hypothetical protein
VTVTALTVTVTGPMVTAVTPMAPTAEHR